MKKTFLILGVALTVPVTALLAQGRGGGGPGGPGGPPPPPGGPGGPGPGHHGPDHGPNGVADDPHRNPMYHALLRALDTDGDGIISMSEMNHAADALLKLDKNNDGMLSHGEIVGPGHHGPDGPPPPPPPKPDGGDKGNANNGDPNAAPKAIGDKDDQNAAGDNADKPKRDGDKGNRRGPKKDGDGGNPNGGGDNPPPPPPPKEDEQRSALVDAIDTNHDGEISADEIAAARANLKKLDLNHDGKLEPHEYGRPHTKNN